MTDEEKIERAAEEYAIGDKDLTRLADRESFGRISARNGFKAGVAWRDKNPSPAIEGFVVLLKSLNVQAIINGQDGHRSVSDRINNALSAYHAHIGGKE